MTPPQDQGAPLRVTVVDALMGAGKTRTAIEKMRAIAAHAQFPDGVPAVFQRDGFVSFTPFLDEVERVKLALSEHAGVIAFDPKPVGGRKLPELNRLLSEGKN